LGYQNDDVERLNIFNNAAKCFNIVYIIVRSFTVVLSTPSFWSSKPNYFQICI